MMPLVAGLVAVWLLVVRWLKMPIFDRVLAPHLGEIVADVGLEFLQLQRVLGVVGPQAQWQPAVGGIRAQLRILRVVVVEGAVVWIVDRALLQRRDLPRIKTFDEAR